MLKQNVYIMFPAGYSGSYLRWAISISDKDLKPFVPANPLNDTASDKLGGTGTAHVYPRIPTHQSYSQLLNWIIANRPTDKRVYLVNVAGDKENSTAGSPEFAASMFLRSDPEAMVINIHDGNDMLTEAYANINCVLKWPTFMAVTFAFKGIVEHNVFKCNTREFRNLAVERKDIFHQGRPLDMNHLKIILHNEMRWYEIRNRHQPHEVNSTTYPHLEKFKTHTDLDKQLFQLSCKDIAYSFMPLLDELMGRNIISSDYDTSYVSQFHENYVKAQDNLQVFKSISDWRATGKLDDYLKSHAITEAYVIRFMLAELAVESESLSDRTKQVFADWKTKSIEELNDAYQTRT